MKTTTIEFVYEAQRETARCEETGEGTDVVYNVQPDSKTLLQKYGKTTFTQTKGEFLTGEPISDLTYYTSLKEGLENYLFGSKK